MSENLVAIVSGFICVASFLMALLGMVFARLFKRSRKKAFRNHKVFAGVCLGIAIVHLCLGGVRVGLGMGALFFLACSLITGWIVSRKRKYRYVHIGAVVMAVLSVLLHVAEQLLYALL